MILSRTAHLIALVAGLAACGATTPADSDAGTQSSSDAATLAGADAATAPGADAGATGDAGTAAVTTALTGTLGTLGAVKPTVSSIWITNSGETLIYLSSATLTCAQVKVSRWLGAYTSGAQVVELIVSGTPKLGDTLVPPGEANYAAGGKSSAYEVVADSGKLTFTRVDAAVLEGKVTATYPSGNLSGTFHAEFCPSGQGY